MNHRRKLIAVLVGAICATANADTVTNPRQFRSNPCGPIAIAFVNGIGVTSDEAAENLNLLARSFGNAYKWHPISYVLGYNQTSGIPYDFYQSLLKVISSKAGATWTNFYNAVQSGIYASGMTPALAASISKTVDDLFGFIKPAPYEDADLAAIYSDLATHWTYGTRMVAVTHSEGNLFAVDLFNKLVAGGVPSSSIGFVGVANPHSTSPVVSFTSRNDLVIDSIRTAVANIPSMLPPLAANITIPYNYTADKLGHSWATYWNDPGARAQMITAITDKLNGLKTPIKLGTANTGPSRFQGAAWSSDCTGVPPFGDMSKWPNVWPAGRDLNTCGSGASLYPTPYFVPMVFYRVAGQTTQIARPGEASEVPGLAAAHRDGCIAAAASFWSAYVATGAVAGTYGNCADYGSPNGYGSDNRIELAFRYRDLKSGDDGKTVSWSTTWTATSLGIGPYVEGGTKVYTGPTCNN